MAVLINLIQLNSFIRYQHYKMEGLDYVKFVLQKGYWLVKIDLKDAYFLVPLSLLQKKNFVFSGMIHCMTIFVCLLGSAQPLVCLQSC
jgi:hypothetical protein